MNTKKYALAFIAIAALLLALSTPAAADYSGDHPLKLVKWGWVDGGVIYETVTDGSGYTQLDAINSATYSQNITINIPAGATVKLARAYNYYSWSKPDYANYSNPGLPAEADFAFNGASVTCQNPSEDISEIPNPIHYGNGIVQYWDSKGQGYSSTKYDCPSGTFAADVTKLVTGSGTYTAIIKNNDSSPTTGEYFNTAGFGLLVVYENAKPKIPTTKYWITEGCDMLMSRTYETPENATTKAVFRGWAIPRRAIDANMKTVVLYSDTGENMVYFNRKEVGQSTAVSSEAIGVNDFDVLDKLRRVRNVARFQDRDDYETVTNAFLVIDYKWCRGDRLSQFGIEDEE